MVVTNCHFQDKGRVILTLDAIEAGDGAAIAPILDRLSATRTQLREFDQTIGEVNKRRERVRTLESQLTALDGDIALANADCSRLEEDRRRDPTMLHFVKRGSADCEVKLTKALSNRTLLTHQLDAAKTQALATVSVDLEALNARRALLERDAAGGLADLHAHRRDVLAKLAEAALPLLADLHSTEDALRRL
jgi:hypothetical protein